MYGKIFINIFLIIVLIIFQISFIRGLPDWLNNLNLVLIVLNFILGLASLRLALGWAIGAGILLDVYSFLPFGIYTVCLLLTMLFANWLLVNFFTNRSLYSFLALIFCAEIFFEILLQAINFLYNFFFRQNIGWIYDKYFWLSNIEAIFVNLLAVTAAFYFLHFISKRLKPVFLIKRKS